jgi:hypothetical protein
LRSAGDAGETASVGLVGAFLKEMDAGDYAKVLSVVAVAVGLVIVRVLARRRIDKMEATRACLSCESTDVVEQAGMRTCMACGYQGRADGGGKIDHQVIDEMYEKPRPRLFDE